MRGAGRRAHLGVEKGHAARLGVILIRAVRHLGVKSLFPLHAGRKRFALAGPRRGGGLRGGRPLLRRSSSSPRAHTPYARAAPRGPPSAGPYARAREAWPRAGARSAALRGRWALQQPGWGVGGGAVLPGRSSGLWCWSPTVRPGQGADARLDRPAGIPQLRRCSPSPSTAQRAPHTCAPSGEGRGAALAARWGGQLAMTTATKWHIDPRPDAANSASSRLHHFI